MKHTLFLSTAVFFCLQSSCIFFADDNNTNDTNNSTVDMNSKMDMKSQLDMGKDMISQPDMISPPDMMERKFFRAYLTKPVQLVGGVEEADDLCNADMNKPLGGTFKAFIASDSRHACKQAGCEMRPNFQPVGWVLQKNATYVFNENNRPVPWFDTDDKALIKFLMRGKYPGNDVNWMSGFNRDWSYSPNRTCTNWTNIDATIKEQGVGWTGKNGQAQELSNGFLDGGLTTCEKKRPLVCVEQPMRIP